MTAVKPYYEYDSSVAYFVDCGDHGTATVSAGDKFGLYNCLTEQLYGADNVTGMAWGIVDDPTDQYNGSGPGNGIYTANTWPDERNTQDGRDKTASFRYTKNQYEHDIDRILEYGFTLPKGKYQIEIGFADPWDCSNNPTVTLVSGKKETKLAEALDLSASKTVNGSFTVSDNSNVNLRMTSESQAINVTYRQHRTELVVQMRSQIFRQIV